MAKNAHAVAMAKRRWRDVPPAERSRIMREAIRTRWRNHKKKPA